MKFLLSVGNVHVRTRTAVLLCAFVLGAIALRSGLLHYWTLCPHGANAFVVTQGEGDGVSRVFTAERITPARKSWSDPSVRDALVRSVKARHAAGEVSECDLKATLDALDYLATWKPGSVPDAEWARCQARVLIFAMPPPEPARETMVVACSARDLWPDQSVHIARVFLLGPRGVLLGLSACAILICLAGAVDESRRRRSVAHDGSDRDC